MTWGQAALVGQASQLELALELNGGHRAILRSTMSIAGVVKGGHLPELDAFRYLKAVVEKNDPKRVPDFVKCWDSALRKAVAAHPKSRAENRLARIENAQTWLDGVSMDPELQGVTGAKALAVLYLFAQVSVASGKETIDWTDAAIARKLDIHTNTIRNLKAKWCIGLFTVQKGRSYIDRATGEIISTQSTYRIREVPFTPNGLAPRLDDELHNPTLPRWAGRLAAWRIYTTLTEPFTATEVAKTLGITAKTARHHLKVMETAGEVKRDGNFYVALPSESIYDFSK